MTITAPVLISGAALGVAINRFARAGAFIDKMTHQLAVSVLSHANSCGDIRPMAKLIMSMPASGRANALRKWLEEYGPVVFNKGMPIYTGSKLDASLAAFAKASITPFWVDNPEPDYKAVDVIKQIDGLMKKLERDALMTNRDHSIYVRKLKEMLPQQNIVQ